MIYTYPGQSRKPDSKPHAISKQYHSGGVLKTIPHKEVDFGATQLKHQKYHNFVGLQCYHINSWSNASKIGFFCLDPDQGGRSQRRSRREPAGGDTPAKTRGRRKSGRCGIWPLVGSLKLSIWTCRYSFGNHFKLIPTRFFLGLFLLWICRIDRIDPPPSTMVEGFSEGVFQGGGD
jgi:hypothetical protein